MKLLVFLLATTPSLVHAGVVSQSANPPSCKDIAWDEHDNGFQTRICTEPHPSTNEQVAQSMIAKRSDNDAVDRFESIFTSFMPNTTETNIDNCASSSHTPSTLNENQDKAQNINGTTDITNSNNTIQRRDTCASSALPYRSQLIDLAELSSKSWCFRPGPTPNPNDVTSLCRNIAQLKYFGARESATLPFHDDYVVQRAKTSSSSSGTTAGVTRDNTTVAVETDGACVCVAGRERTAGFKICNCDRCDALMINRGLADMCKTLQRQCTSQGFSSGYIKSSLHPSSTTTNSLISLFTYPTSKGPKSAPMELDPILGVEGVVSSSCRSGDENRRGQDYSGPVIECWDWVVGRFAGGRWCRDVVGGGERVWVREREDPMEKLRGVKKGGFSQFGDE